jgi:hypothetical protein
MMVGRGSLWAGGKELGRLRALKRAAGIWLSSLLCMCFCYYATLFYWALFIIFCGREGRFRDLSLFCLVRIAGPGVQGIRG